METTELAARRHIDAWLAPDREQRAQLDACFAASGRLVTRTRTFRGTREIAAMVDAALADPRGLSAGRTTAIDATGTAFRFATFGTFADGSPYAFAGRLRLRP